MERMDLSPSFLRSVVWVNDFNFTYEHASLTLLCIEQGREVEYLLDLNGVSQFGFIETTKEDDPVFEVIDALLEKEHDILTLNLNSGTHRLKLSFTNCSIRPVQAASEL
jgi:hypothetical protein